MRYVNDKVGKRMRRRAGSRLRWGVLALVLGASCGAAVQAACAPSVLDVEEKRLLGGSENLCQTYGGQVVLVVNTASHCGYTPQYEGLQRLYERYKDRGFTILGFPSNDFFQEGGDDQQIAKFCKVNYGVGFPMFEKTAVRGSDANPLYKALRAATQHQPTWNFNKYLISRDGQHIVHYASDVGPDSPELLQAIDAALQSPQPQPQPQPQSQP